MPPPASPGSGSERREPAAAGRGLSAGELRDALTELNRGLLPATVIDAAPLQGKDDLLLFVEPRTGGARRAALHVVPGSSRGRVTVTARRFARHEFASGPQAEQVRSRLAGAVLEHAEALPGERIARLSWQGPGGTRGALVVELFGNRGLWAVLDGDGRMVAQSRVPHAGDRTLGPQTPWQPPPPRPGAPEPPPRFAPPVLAAIDAHFTAADQANEAESLRETCARALARARTSLAHRIAGLQQKLASADEAPRLRARADLMLAYAHLVRRGATTMRVPDPERDGSEVEIELQPDKPVVVQAQALYDRARRLTDAIAHTEQRLAQAQAESGTLEPHAGRLAQATSFAELAAVRDELARAGLLPRPPRPAADGKGTAAGGKKAVRPAADEAYRRFVSREGYEILCGKTNAQNDRLSLRTARGNDVWLHVGRGYAGSHVVVRVPKGKSASLETLLDAALIAVHFSKARGAGKAEVIYTQAKFVRKPKGSPAGQVVPSQTKTLFVRADEARLRELLGGGGDEA